MAIPFSKYEGCGNDFILIDNRNTFFPFEKKSLISKLCHRSIGIGADGLILLENSSAGDFKMKIFNSDGSEAEMCGNGIRCLARFISEIGAAEKDFTIETMAGISEIAIEKGSVAVSLPEPTELQWNLSLPLGASPLPFHFLNTGVPHAVFFVEDLYVEKWFKIAPEIRHHPFFLPRGTNVNFVQIKNHEIYIRTYERGVERETEACGTGATAAALAAGFIHQIPSPATVFPKSNTPLQIFFECEKEKIFNVKLAGPAQKIFSGEIILD